MPPDDFEKTYHKGYGECSNPEFFYTGDGYPDDCSQAGLAYGDYEGYSAHFETGPEFGCVHFEEK